MRFVLWAAVIVSLASCGPKSDSTGAADGGADLCTTNITHLYDDCHGAVTLLSGPQSKSDAIVSCQVFGYRCVSKAASCSAASACGAYASIVASVCSEQPLVQTCAADLARYYGECQGLVLGSAGGISQADMTATCSKSSGLAICIHNCAFKPDNRTGRACADYKTCFGSC